MADLPLGPCMCLIPTAPPKELPISLCWKCRGRVGTSVPFANQFAEIEDWANHEHYSFVGGYPPAIAITKNNAVVIAASDENGSPSVQVVEEEEARNAVYAYLELLSDPRAESLEEINLVETWWTAREHIEEPE